MTTTSSMHPGVFTIGYEKRSLDEYLALLTGARITAVVDVRETAWSHKPGFSKSAFSAALAAVGILYVHAKFAGNPKALRASATSHAECLHRYSEYLDADPEILLQLDALLGDMIDAGHRVALTCFERHPGDCHRSILADAWSQVRRRPVTHLSPLGCPRLVTV